MARAYGRPPPSVHRTGLADRATLILKTPRVRSMYSLKAVGLDAYGVGRFAADEETDPRSRTIPGIVVASSGCGVAG